MSPEQDQFLDQLYRKYAGPLWRYAKAYLKDPGRAEEVVQDAFHAAAAHVDDLMKHEAPQWWLKKTVKNKMLKSEEARRRYTHRFLSLDTEVPAEGADPEAMVEEQTATNASAAEKIQDALRPDELYLLRRIVLEKATHMEMAQELGITVWDSQKRLQRIREKLRRVFPERKKK